MKFWNIVVSLGCFLMIGLQSPVEGKQAESKNQYEFHGNEIPLRLHGKMSGVRLYVDTVNPKAYREGGRERLVLERDGKKRIVWNLNLLRGSVRVVNKRDALRYVRVHHAQNVLLFRARRSGDYTSPRPCSHALLRCGKQLAF